MTERECPHCKQMNDYNAVYCLHCGKITSKSSIAEERTKIGSTRNNKSHSNYQTENYELGERLFGLLTFNRGMIEEIKHSEPYDQAKKVFLVSLIIVFFIMFIIMGIRNEPLIT